MRPGRIFELIPRLCRQTRILNLGFKVVTYRAHQALPLGRAHRRLQNRQPDRYYWFKEFKAL